MKLTESEKQSLLKLAPSSARTGQVEFRMCHICGGAEWVCSDSKKPDRVVAFEDLFRPPCGFCQDVMQRAPEITRWVLNVVGYGEFKRTHAEDPPQEPR